MYDELVKNLRICSRCDFGQDCNGCTQKSDDAFCCDKLLHEAADAIEELSRENESLAKSVNEASEILHRRKRWIPMTERLPKKSGDYLVYSIGGTWKQVSNIEIMFYDGERFFTSSFYCPIYWMPLPEPPKEGSDGLLR